MKKISLSLPLLVAPLLLGLTTIAFAPVAHAGDDDDIKAAAAAMDAAWAAGNAQQILALHTDDALVVNPAGIGAKGKKEMEQLLGKLTQGPGKSVPKTTVTSIRYPMKDVAVVDADVAGDGPEGKPIIGKRVSVMAKKGGKWLVSDSRAFFLVMPMGNAPPDAKSAPKSAAPAPAPAPKK
jgi:uncharacterized protein (TIGR02246 family)